MLTALSAKQCPKSRACVSEEEEEEEESAMI